MGKRIILGALIIVLMNLYSYSKIDSNFSGGIRFGVNLVRIIGDNEYGDNGFTGFHFGPNFKYKINDKLRLQTDLLFLVKPRSIEYPIFLNNGVSSGIANIYPAFIELPIIVQYKPLKWVYLEAGFQPSFILKRHFESLEYMSEGGFEIQELGNKSDFVPVVGLGVESKKISFGFRSIVSIFNISPIYNLRNFEIITTIGLKLF